MNKKQVIWIVVGAVVCLLAVGAVLLGLGLAGMLGNAEPTEAVIDGLVDFDNIDMNATQPQLNATQETTEPSVQSTDIPDTPEEPIVGDSDATKPTYDATEPTEKPVAPDVPDNTQPDEKDTTYAEYLAMSNADKQKFMESFSSTQAFMDWLDAAKAAHEGDNSTEIGGGNITIP